MVRIVDDGSHFDAPIEKVWKLIEAHGEHMTEIHSDVKHPKMSAGGENQGIIEWMHEEGGHKFPMKLRVTAVPPTAQILEIQAGPLAGSTVVNYYTPKGARTGITVIADFQSTVLPPAELEAAGRGFLDTGFEADTAYLRKMK